MAEKEKEEEEDLSPTHIYGVMISPSKDCNDDDHIDLDVDMARQAEMAEQQLQQEQQQQQQQEQQQEQEQRRDEEEELRRRSGQSRSIFTSEEVEQLKHRIAAASYRLGRVDVAGLFDRMDKDRSGELELTELATHLKRLMPTVSKKQMAHFFKAIDADSSGSVSKGEFVNFIDQRESESPRKRRSLKGGKSLAEVQAEAAALGNKPRTPSSSKKPPRDPSQSTLMNPTQARLNDIAAYEKSKAEINAEDDPWWEKRTGKLDGIRAHPSSNMHMYKVNYIKQRIPTSHTKLHQPQSLDLLSRLHQLPHLWRCLSLL